MDVKLCSCVVITAYVISICRADTLDIYNTKQATSDLQWDKHSASQDGGWEEVSSFDENFQNTIRSYQVCDTDGEDNSQNNWIRSPFIDSRGGKRIYLEVEFSIARCSTNPTEGRSSKCKETFNIFYYEANTNVATSTFPPWREDPYVKVDTVAANAVNNINKKTFSFGPLSRNGFYIAVQDQGACMSLIALRVYYYYCPETSKNLATFPRTISDVGIASLVTQEGECTENAELLTDGQVPRYRCSSNGLWQIQTGQCQCKEGYQANKINTDCFACSEGTYKLKSGSEECVPCPNNSGLPVPPSALSTTAIDKRATPHNQCPCHSGYARAPDEDISVACSKPPSEPRLLVVRNINATSARLHWQSPKDYGGREDMFYSFACLVSSAGAPVPTKWPCPNSVSYLAPSRDGKFSKTFVQIAGLSPYKKYFITVRAGNGASEAIGEQFKIRSEAEVDFQTEEAVPSHVTDVKVTEQTATTISLEWQEPVRPNGKILAYEVRQLRKAKPTTRFSSPTQDSMLPIVLETKENSIMLTDLEENTLYEVRIRARTSAGFGPYSEPSTGRTVRAPPAQDPDKSKDVNMVPIIIGICGFLFLAFVFAIICRYCMTGKLFCLNTARARNKTKGRQLLSASPHQDNALHERLIVNLPPQEQRIYVEYPDPLAAISNMKMEINSKDIRIEEVIGTGEFSEVCRGKLYLNNQGKDVAIKRLKAGATRKDQSNFLREATTMAQFNDPNIVQLKGVVTKHRPVMIVSEYMEHKSLDNYLKLNKEKLSILQLVTMLRGIASGMRYLSSMKYVHRDLAARNILVDSDLVCKVSDFGLSRTLENDPHATYTTQGGKIAIRWTALESILYRQFTSASDVWSFGIVMWEVMSYGEKPYWDMSNEDVIKNIQSGMRLPSPYACPKVIHDLMVKCWIKESSSRPTFVQLLNNFDILLKQPAQLQQNNSFLHISESAMATATPSLGRAMDSGQVDSVEKFLEVQRLSNYTEHFRERGIDSLEKLSNLTLNDLKALGINVTLHMSKLENGIRTLKRHLSTCSPSSSARTSTASET